MGKQNIYILFSGRGSLDFQKHLSTDAVKKPVDKKFGSLSYVLVYPK